MVRATAKRRDGGDQAALPADEQDHAGDEQEVTDVVQMCSTSSTSTGPSSASPLQRVDLSP